MERGGVVGVCTSYGVPEQVICGIIVSSFLACWHLSKVLEVETTLEARHKAHRS
jgi:hypothetical protein